MSIIDEELTNFIVEAKKKTYAAKKSNEIVLSDGGRKLIYKSDKYIYEDVYYGTNPFYGRELAGRRDVIGKCWIMQYQGMILPEVSKYINANVIYSHLKFALRQVSPDFPYRGPERFRLRIGNYRCISTSFDEDRRFLWGYEFIEEDGVLGIKELYHQRLYYGSFQVMIF